MSDRTIVSADAAAAPADHISRTGKLVDAAAPKDERAMFVNLMGYDRPETEGVAQDTWDSQRATWLEALEYARAAVSQPTAELTPREISALRELKKLGEHRYFAIRSAIAEAWPIVERLTSRTPPAQPAAAAGQEAVRYFVHDNECGYEEFDTEEARDKAHRAAIDGYLDDGWGEEVTSVVSGIVTHVTVKTDEEHRPQPCAAHPGHDDEDCDACAAWNEYPNHDFETCCRYEPEPITTAPPAQVATRQGLTDEQIIECAGKYRIDHYGDYSRNASEHTRDLLAFAHALLDGAKQ